MIQVVEVRTRKQIKEFIEFPLNLYKNNPYFVPPLYMDEKKLFKNNAYLEQSETVYYNAYMDGQIVGRISGILQRVSNEKWQQKRVRFTRFDSIDNQKVADALFAKVEEWAKSKGMEEVVGPLGFTDLEREGLLIEGFDYLSTFEEQYNAPYYQKLIENCGYVKEVDWLEHRIFPPQEIDERVLNLSHRIMERYHLKLVDCKNVNEFIKRYGMQFFDILDKTYNNIYGVVPLTDKMKKEAISGFKAILTMDYIRAVVDENDRIVSFGLTFPSIGSAVQKSGGRLTLPTIIKIKKAVKHPKSIDFGLVGVVEEYRAKGAGAIMFALLLTQLRDTKVEYAETNLNLETNYAIINQWKSFSHIQHKRRRSFVKKI